MLVLCGYGMQCATACTLSRRRLTASESVASSSSLCRGTLVLQTFCQSAHGQQKVSNENDSNAPGEQENSWHIHRPLGDNFGKC